MLTQPHHQSQKRETAHGGPHPTENYGRLKTYYWSLVPPMDSQQNRKTMAKMTSTIKTLCCCSCSNCSQPDDTFEISVYDIFEKSRNFIGPSLISVRKICCISETRNFQKLREVLKRKLTVCNTHHTHTHAPTMQNIIANQENFKMLQRAVEHTHVLATWTMTMPQL